MKKTILFNILIFCSIIITAQTQHITDSLYKKLHQEVNIVNTSSGRSDVVWERVNVPSNLNLRSFFVTNENNLLIGTEGTSNSGGVYQYYNNNSWMPIGLNTSTINFIGQNNNNDLIIGVYNRIYKHNNQDSTWHIKFTSSAFCYYYFGIDSLLFVGNSGIIRSEDDGENWNLITNFPSSSTEVREYTATNPDSIFVGTTLYTGNGGGVYLSDDGGNTWNHFGLYDHFIMSMAVDNNNLVYAGNNGHYETGQGGLYRYNYEVGIWDTIFYFPYIESIIFNSENNIYTGFNLSGADDWGGVMHSEDNGETWILDTAGMGNTWVSDIQIDNAGFLYAMAGYPDKRLYKTILPVSIINKFDNKINFYPNPSSNTIKIIIGNVLSRQNITIKVFNIYGDCMINNETNYIEKDNNITLNVSNLELGIYICQIQKNNIKSNFKFIKQ